MKNLWTDQLPVSKRAMKLTRKISFLETSPQGFKLSGKTGSNYYDHNYDQDKRVGLEPVLKVGILIFNKAR